MDRRECFERLDSKAGDPESLFEHFERRESDRYNYLALSNARHGIERGTVVIEEPSVIVRGYPKIPRILRLETGIGSFFDGKIAIEEKLDGVNVRIAAVEAPMAFTRSGYHCPYTTARASELLELGAFFDRHPDKLLCAELVGPETPYTTHDYPDIDSHTFCVFDVCDRESGVSLGVSERRALCEEFGFDQPRLFETVDTETAPSVVRSIIQELDATNREGVVLKSLDGSVMAKYTTRSQHHNELAYGFSLPFDRGRDFVFSRIVREAFQAAEFEDDDEALRERARTMGESILLPIVETIRDVENGEPIGERFVVRGTPAQIDALFDHLTDQSLRLVVLEDDTESGERVVKFVKTAESTRDQIEYYLEEGINRE
ncbi:RNA ligase [Halocatena halophila]|uniref:RNA ligase n=1 Tax=Halocatena halophila TaxID=2814576 RepID=UPI002ED5F085